VRRILGKIISLVNWNSCIGVFMESYMTMSISALINIKYREKDDDLAEKLNLVLAYGGVSVAVITPILIAVFFSTRDLTNPHFKKRFGFIYGDLDPQYGPVILLIPLYTFFR